MLAQRGGEVVALPETQQQWNPHTNHHNRPHTQPFLPTNQTQTQLTHRCRPVTASFRYPLHSKTTAQTTGPPQITSKHHRFSDRVNWSNTQHTHKHKHKHKKKKKKKMTFLFIYLTLGCNQGKFVEFLSSEWRWAYNTPDPHSKSRRKSKIQNFVGWKC